ncbi:MAG TPA: low-complexity protein, partial [Cyanobacteria bacterium UBA11162]|nr:low-complexity protein [Cyanobacteria bacterium UBA11162]
MTNEQSRLDLQTEIQRLIEVGINDFLELARVLGRNPLADFAGVNLRGVNFNGADLRGADFHGSDLGG